MALYEVRSGTITIPTSDTVSAGTVTEELNGEFGNLVVKVPALEGTGTSTFRLIDPLLGTLSEIIQDESTTKLGTPTFKFYTGTLTCTATANGTQSAARAITYGIYYKTKQG